MQFEIDHGLDEFVRRRTRDGIRHVGKNSRLLLFQHEIPTEQKIVGPRLADVEIRVVMQRIGRRPRVTLSCRYVRRARVAHGIDVEDDQPMRNGDVADLDERRTRIRAGNAEIGFHGQ
jgi:hypothetical protein